MNVIANEKLIKRNARIAQYTGLAGLLVLAGGMIILWRYPQQFTYVWLMVIFGFVLSQVGIYFTNRWGRRPRPDEYLNNALKGLDSNYSLYHYRTPAPHLLVGPAGVWVLLPQYQRGTILYSKGRYRQKGGGFMVNYLKIFGQEGLGRPELDAEAKKEAITKYLHKLLEDQEVPDVQAAIVFTDDRAELKTDDAPLPTMEVKKLKDFLRKSAKSKPVSMSKVKLIQQAIEG